jgi:hypothetical protein
MLCCAVLCCGVWCGQEKTGQPAQWVLGVSRQRVNDWLAGRVHPTGEQALLLRQFLEKGPTL